MAPHKPNITLYGTELSGHSHRVELLLRMLELPYRLVDAAPTTHGSPEFLRLNPLRQIPVLQDGSLTLADSNAILVYLAKRDAPGNSWLPEEPVAGAQVQRWLSIAAGELRYGPAIARLICLWKFPAALTRARQIADVLLRFMNDHLQTRTFLAAPSASIANLACYSYVAHAPEGGIAIGEYPKVMNWLRRVEALPHFKPMPSSPLAART